jgi:hypothetical protein
MGRQGDCITIVRKDGKRAVIPLQLWEDGHKMDKDWRIESKPILNTPEVKVERVVIEKPVQKAPEPVAPPVVVEPVVVPVIEAPKPKVEKEKTKRVYRHKHKG